jgi:hypothetical protein
MFVPLDTCDCIIATVQQWFANYAVFPKISSELKQAIPHLLTKESITTDDVKKVTSKYSLFGRACMQQEGVKSVVERIFQTTTVYILATRKETQAIQWATVDDLLFSYPQFVEASDDERLRLLRFRNAMRVALSVLPAKRNKDRLLRIASKLEGAGRDYITGTGQSEDVDRRVAIYEMEGGVEAEKRQPRERRRMIDRANNGEQRHTRKRERYLQLDTPVEEKPTQYVSAVELEAQVCSFALHHDFTAVENPATPRKRAKPDANGELYHTPVVGEPILDWGRNDDATDVSPLTDNDAESLDLTDFGIDLADLDRETLDGFSGVDRSHLFGDGDLGDLQDLAYLL